MLLKRTFLFVCLCLAYASAPLHTLRAQEPRSLDDKHTVPLLNHLLGVELHNAEGASLGELDDIAFKQDGTLRYAIIGTGGVLDIGEDHLAVPWEQLKIDWSERSIAIDITRDRLLVTGRLKQKGYKELDDPAWMAKFSDSYNLGGDIDLNEEEVKATLDTKLGVEFKADPQQSKLTYGKLRSVHLATELIGCKATDSSGQEVAEVEYLVANQESNRVSLVILGKGGLFDLGETLIPVPWSATKPKSHQTTVVVSLQLSEEQLRKAPRVSGDFPALLDKSFVEQIQSHYVQKHDN